MTVHVSTLIGPCDDRTIVTLEGEADEGLIAMLAEGISSLRSPGRELVVDLGRLVTTDATERRRFAQRLTTAGAVLVGNR